MIKSNSSSSSSLSYVSSSSSSSAISDKYSSFDTDDNNKSYEYEKVIIINKDKSQNMFKTCLFKTVTLINIPSYDQKNFIFSFFSKFKINQIF